MRILVHDANLLIDLFHGGVLEIWFAQGYEIHTTSLVLTELTDADQKAAANDLVSLGAPRKIRESGSFLPQADCRMRIEKWSGG